MSATPKASWPWVKTLLHSVYDQPDAASVHAQFDPLVDAVADKLPKVAAHGCSWAERQGMHASSGRKTRETHQMRQKRPVTPSAGDA